MLILHHQATYKYIIHQLTLEQMSLMVTGQQPNLALALT